MLICATPARPEELARRLGAYAKKLPKGRWILGGDWDHEKWPGAPLPTKEMIDAATPDHPVFVNRLDGHMALANSLALKLAGVTKETKDPPGGLIVRDPKTGEPTGILKDGAESLVERVVPDKTFEEKHVAAKAATEHAAQVGVTSVTDMSADGDVGLYQYMLERGELKTRIYAIRSIVSWEVLAKTGVRAAFGSDWLRIGGLKGFADGSLGSSTALFFEPYNDAPDTRGLLFDQMLPEGIMLQRVEGADKAGPADYDPCHRRRGKLPHPRHLPAGSREERPARPALPHRARPAFARQRNPPLRPAEGHRLDAAVSRGRRRALVRQAHRPGTLERRLRLPLAARLRRRARVRLGLDGRPAQPAGGRQGGGDAADARRQTSRRLVAGAEAHP